MIAIYLIRSWVKLKCQTCCGVLPGINFATPSQFLFSDSLNSGEFIKVLSIKSTAKFWDIVNVLLKPRWMFWLQGVKTSTTFSACSSFFVKPLPLKKNLIRESSSKHESAHCFQWLRSLKVTSGRHVVSKQFLVSNPPRPDIRRSATLRTLPRAR